ncbi:MAG: DUF4149 domain-containing protein [Desulfuromonadales bacterium]|nr:DUF4149 domain-containing protein [Desulfuromonadales bacterium]
MNYLDLLYRLSISLWAGGNAIFTLMLTPILFKTESRDIAARIVGNLFPAYFKWGLVCGVIALVSRLVGRGMGGGRASLVILAVMLVLVLFQALYVEPHAADLKRRIGSFETSSKDDPLRKEFGKLHGVSAVCNLTVLVGGIVLVVLP